MKNERDFRWALVGTAGLSLLGYIIHTYTPDSTRLIFLFFVIIACTTFSWAYFILPTRRIALLMTSFVVVFLLLRLTHLRHPLYTILLIAFLTSLEVIQNKR